MPQQTLGELFTSVMNTVPNEETLAAKANTANPVFTGSISLGRKANTTIGNSSFAVGDTVEASGSYTHAEGYLTRSSNTAAHSEGWGTIANGSYSHAEGYQTIASASGAHAEGRESIASEYNAHAEGYYTIANGRASHASGKYNAEMINYPDWVAGTSYQIGDVVIKAFFLYMCTTANNDDTFNSDHWVQIANRTTYQVFVVGNGENANARSNALTLDWSGDLHLAKDVYVNANANGTGGSKVATEAFVTTRIPAPPVSDGTYILQCVVSSGVPTYSWISAPNASGVSY